MKTIALKLEDKGADLEEAKEETKALCEECQCCSRSVADLGIAVQEFGEQNPLLCKQLGDAVAKLTEVQRNTTQQVQDRANRLKKAERQVEEYRGMKAFILGWTEKAEALVTGCIIWGSASQLQEQIRAHQALLRECRGLHGDLEAMGEREGQLGEVLQTEGWSQQVKHLSRHTEELQQTAKTRLQSLQDAAKDMLLLEAEVKTLHAAVDQIQITLASPDLNRLSLREQLTQRQRLLVEMEGFKQQVAAVQQCQSALRLPLEVVAGLPISHTAQILQQEASQLQHTTIQQCNILQVESSTHSANALDVFVCITILYHIYITILSVKRTGDRHASEQLRCIVGTWYCVTVFGELYRSTSTCSVPTGHLTNVCVFVEPLLDHYYPSILWFWAEFAFKLIVLEISLWTKK
ncbi:Nesprin-1 [Liparis tanakae]|uniref:Nesprin-1 n=1 Tax=Liparis tanakae TaxID=230148 RepID=A0A4Z2HRM8_9TELE|nr:Nesprin-1 [Liparis tanakae]